MLTRIHKENINTKEHFEHYYARPDWRVDWDGADKRLRNALKLINKEYPKHLDVGCADGTFTKFYLEKFPNTKGHGVDISETVCVQAQKNCPEGTFIAADCYHLPFKDNTFDLVHCAEVLEHLESPDLAIEEIRRVLKPGGHFILTTPNENAEDYVEHLWKWSSEGVRLMLETRMGQGKLVNFKILEEYPTFDNGHVMYIRAEKI